MAHTPWTQAAYCYDGSFAGFLTCVFESYVNREAPISFRTPECDQIPLWPERNVETDQAHAGRVYRSLRDKISPEAQELVRLGFLTCLKEKELHLWNLIQQGYLRGARLLQDLTDERVLLLNRAVQHLTGEAHLLKGFVRFSEQAGVLVGEIEPKNRVLPLLRAHFCGRYPEETFLLYDRTHHEALFHQRGQWLIVPLAEFHAAQPGGEEVNYRQLWRRFYDTVAIQGRYNPKLRMTHMPKRYWNTMTEFQQEVDNHPLPQQSFPPRK